MQTLDIFGPNKGESNHTQTFCEATRHDSWAATMGGTPCADALDLAVELQCSNRSSPRCSILWSLRWPGWSDQITEGPGIEGYMPRHLLFARVHGFDIHCGVPVSYLRSICKAFVVDGYYWVLKRLGSLSHWMPALQGWCSMSFAALCREQSACLHSAAIRFAECCWATKYT